MVNETTWTASTPVALAIYNRPEKTARTFEQIAAVEPPELYVIADGPNPGDSEDEKRCRAARDVVSDPDWDCVVHTNFADTNMGIQRRMQTGLNWLFENADEAIIVEDDCLASQSFFRFCEEMLDEYRHDERIMGITGTNFMEEWKSDIQDYHFSTHGGVWGWATWSHAWEKYDPEMSLWENDEVRERLRDYYADDQQFVYIERLYRQMYEGKIETWEYPWGFAHAVNSAYQVVPSKNLVSNVGFDEEATNTNAESSDLENIPRHDLEFPLDRNEYVIPDREYDRRYYELSNSMWEKNRVLRWLRDTGFRLLGKEYVGG